MHCPHCQKEAGVGEFCPTCHRILPASGEQNHYLVLGYDRVVLNLDPSDLEKRFFQLSKKFHPDRFAGKSAFEVQLAHDRSSAVNNAYRTLKDPVSRAGYVVEQELGSSEEKSSQVPADMSDLFFDVHEFLDVIRESNGNPPEAAVREVKKAEFELKEKVRNLEQELRDQFAIYDTEPNREIVGKMKEILSHRSYIKSFLRQVDAVLRGEEKD